jgi:uncharacterized Zn-finger protein
MSDVVVNAQWQCRNCERAFDSRGQRDSHQRSKHQKLVATDGQNTVSRSATSNAFKCPCGKEFSYAHSLVRHSKNCNGTMFMADVSEEDDDPHEGTCH